MNKTNTIQKNSKARALIALMIVGVMIATTILLYLFVFMDRDDSSGGGDTSRERLFEVTSVEILLGGKTDFGDIEIGTDDLQFGLRINDGVDLTNYDEPEIVWGFVDGKSLRNVLDQNGVLSIGNMLGDFEIFVSVTSKNTLTKVKQLSIVPKHNSILESIEIVEPPVRRVFVEGERFDSGGILVEAHFVTKGNVPYNFSAYLSRELLEYTDSIFDTMTTQVGYQL